MPFKQMPPDLTDFNNWWNRTGHHLMEDAKASILGRPQISPVASIKQAMIAAWDESAKLHTEHYAGELARLEAESE